MWILNLAIQVATVFDFNRWNLQPVNVMLHIDTKIPMCELQKLHFNVSGISSGGGGGGNTGGGSNSVANTKSVTSLASSPLSSIKRPTPDSTPPTEQTTIPSQPGSQG